MQVKHEDLEKAVQVGIIAESQKNALWIFLHDQQVTQTIYSRFSNFLYLSGGVLAIAAMTLFITQAWPRLSGQPFFYMTLVLVIMGLVLTDYFNKKNLRLPATLLAIFSLLAVPLMIYNLQIIIGFVPLRYENNYLYPGVEKYWLPMEMGALFVASLLFYRYRFPCLLFIVALIVWYISTDLWAMLMTRHEYHAMAESTLTMYFGLVILAIAINIDFKNKQQDYAFWLYLFGTLAFWGGLSAHESRGELSKLFYAFINVVLLFISVLLNRRIFAICGAIGILAYLSYLAFAVFKNSLAFPMILVALGIMIIVAATYWRQFETRLANHLTPYMPKKIRDRRMDK